MCRKNNRILGIASIALGVGIRINLSVTPLEHHCDCGQGHGCRRHRYGEFLNSKRSEKLIFGPFCAKFDRNIIVIKKLNYTDCIQKHDAIENRRIGVQSQQREFHLGVEVGFRRFAEPKFVV